MINKTLYLSMTTYKDRYKMEIDFLTFHLNIKRDIADNLPKYLFL